MKNLPHPNNDDSTSIDALANNTKVASYPEIIPFCQEIKDAYENYAQNSGNAHLLTPPEVPSNVTDFLYSHYDSPPNCISFINTLREDNDFLCCPMCGSLHGGTLDHFLPRSIYPIFSIYSKNLVPACKCNGFKSNKIPSEQNQRILHPYFDEILSERLISANFKNLGAVPSIDINVVLPEEHPLYPEVNFHVTHIVLKTTIAKYVRKKWGDLYRKPELAIRDLSNKPRDRNHLISIIMKERGLIEETHGSRNTWVSAFLSGLLNDTTLDWVFEKLTHPERQDGTPLGPLAPPP